MSVDGLIAGPHDDLSWLDRVQDGTEDYGYASFNREVDTYIVGRRTFDVVRRLTGGHFPPADQHDCYVLSRSQREPVDGITFWSEGIEELIRHIRSRPGKHIYCDGGAQIVQTLQEKDLIDRYILSVIPVLLGSGTPLFGRGMELYDLELVESKTYPSGLVQLQYQRKR